MVRIPLHNPGQSAISITEEYRGPPRHQRLGKVSSRGDHNVLAVDFGHPISTALLGLDEVE